MKYLLFLLMASAFTSVSAQNSDSIVLHQVDSLIQVSRALTDQRDFKKAIEVNAAAEKLALEILGRESVAYGACCFNLGRVNYYKKDYLEAEKWYLESQAIRERLLGKLHPDYALCLNNLAILYEDQKKLEKAEILYLESKDIREKTLGKEHADYIVSLNNLANFYWEQGQYLKAEPYLVEAKDCRAKALGKDHEDYALSLSFLSSLYKAMGHYDKAELYLLESKSICEQIFGKEHPTYANSLNNLGILYALMGFFDKAEQYYLESLEIRKKVLGNEHPSYASSLNNLALVYAELGNYEKAERLHLEAIAIREKVFGKDHLDYGSSLGNLADLYSDIGNYKKAEPLYLEAIEIKVRILGKDDPSYAAILNNLAILYRDMGNYEKAERYYLESIAIREKVLGKDHPYYAVSLNNLAELYWKLNNYQKAETFYLEAKAIQEKVLGKEHPNYAASINNLALIYKQKQNYEKAEQYYLESKSIREKVLGKEHPSYASSLINLANLYMLLNDYTKAEQYFLESKSILENLVGKEHTYYAQNIKSLAQLYARTNRTSESEVLVVESTALEQFHLIKASTFLSEEELQKYVSLFQLNSHQIGSYLLTNQQKENAPQKSLLPELMYNSALFYKGFLLQEVNKINGLVQATPESREIQKRLMGFRRRLSAEYSKPIAHRTDVSELEELANHAEKELVRSVTGYNEASRQVFWQDVKTGLKPSEAVIEFVHFQVNFPQITDSTMYAALLIMPGTEQPMFIPLFEEKSLDLLLNSKSDRKADYVNSLYALADRGLVKLGNEKNSLYELIWKPLEKELAEIKTLYYSPSGLLHRINFDAIPVSETETIADKYHLITLNSTRQLVIPTQIKNGNNDALLFGGIQFEQDSTVHNNEPLLAARSRGELSFISVDSTLRGGTWNYLAGTEREVNAIEKIMETSGLNTSLKKGYEATEEIFKNIGANNSPSPRILHIATHGYFFPDPETNTTNGERSEAEPVFKLSDHPMLRSGLIMASGNAAWQGIQTLEGREDGILTAYEISQMNLSNTELVVLSACETGLGDIQGNEGVFGLQRAFKIAGAKYLIMSLWQVPDKQTSLLMTTFYKKWLEEKMTIRDAFHAAQKELRDIGLDPYQWAGFVLVE